MKVDAQALNHRRFWDAMGRLTRAPIAQRGKAKQKRVDLRLVGLALVVTASHPTWPKGGRSSSPAMVPV